MKRKDWQCGLDIGSESVRAVLARVHPGEPEGSTRLEILAVGQAKAQGMQDGGVVRPEAASDSIRRAMEELEQSAGVEVGEAWVSIGARNRRSINSSGEVRVQSETITDRDVERAVRSAIPQPGRETWLCEPYELLHALPQEYWVDDLDGARDPTGWSGERIQAFVHLVSCPRDVLRRVEKAVNTAGVSVRGMALSSFATAEGVFEPEENTDEFLLMDIGAANTGLAVVRAGAVWWSDVMPTGGSAYTRDVSLGLQTPFASAEEAKRRFGHALFGAVSEDETFELSIAGSGAPHLFKRRILARILQARAESDMTLLRDNLRKWLERMPGRIVISGGGANLAALDEVVRLVFGAAVERRGPRNVTGLADRVDHAQFAAAVGLCRLGAKKDARAAARAEPAGIVPRLVRSVGEEVRRVAGRLWRAG